MLVRKPVYYFIDMTCPQDSQVSMKKFKRLATYKDLQIKVSKM